MTSQQKDIDAVLEKMRSVIAFKSGQDPDYYARYPMELASAANPAALQTVADTWALPADYAYFLQRYVPVSVVWSTDDYSNLQIYGAHQLAEGQLGYSYNPVTREPITDWPQHYLVIAMDEGDPYCLDLSRGDTVVYTAMHGTGRWDFDIAYDDLGAFLRSTLVPRGHDESEAGEAADQTYARIFLTGEGSDRVKTLLFLKKSCSCDVTQARQLLASLPLQVYQGIDAGADQLEAQLQSIGAEYERHSISLAEFIGLSSEGGTSDV